MAGDWIKMRADLAEDPAVIAIGAKLGMDEFSVVGRLQCLWSWADGQSRDGHASGVTQQWVDRKVQRDGFAQAMCDVGWLSVDNSGITFPNFDNHNGETAKTRALGTKRKQKERSAPPSHAPVADSVRDMSRSGRDKSETREEKRREEKEEPPNPPQAGGGGGGEGQSPTKAGTICRAIKARGVPDVNPSNPELLALIGQGVTVETFEAAADTCIKSTPPKGMAYLLGIVRRQLGEAAAIASGPKATAATVDPDSQSAVEAEGVRLGFGKWTQMEPWHAYKGRVRAKQQSEQPASAGVH
ncbi:hypothetical protein J2W30_003680 [Variovorax boronicumulans]|uniref:hypothetical protein n=1 Tax=Variovorax boronicumulans TaxID=436515 RepID=UPI00277FE9AE|nr:hypothetical protein [Variovorax boronicumulans]MDQ0035907.1 hypothetical protein [Variovorax boronicumulans]